MDRKLLLITICSLLCTFAYGQGAGSSGGHVRRYECATQILANYNPMKGAHQLILQLMSEPCFFTKSEAEKISTSFFNGSFDEENFTGALDPAPSFEFQDEESNSYPRKTFNELHQGS